MKNVHPLKIPEKNNVHDYLREYIITHDLKTGMIIGIGGLEYAEIGYFNPATRSYYSKELKASETILEVSSLIGNYIVKQDGAVSIHIHVTISTPSGAIGGHLLKGIAQPFLEVFLVELDEDLLKGFRLHDR